jgi:NTP pyrophosphatase (non-canonical NTP hydrolase)
MSWLQKYAEVAAATDLLTGRPNHPELLATGLMGEAGSILTELKKEQREREAYPAYRHRMNEEIGDFLWYFVRLISTIDKSNFAAYESELSKPSIQHGVDSIAISLKFAGAVGTVLASIDQGQPKLHGLLLEVWRLLCALAQATNTDLEAAADGNIKKIHSRWPEKRVYNELFDGDYPEEEQLPRHLDIEFREIPGTAKKTTLLRCNNLNFGDRLTDNIREGDGYRFHDIFHFSYAVHLGWSPVTRSLLRVKRKSKPEIDEGEDGARAGIIEEAVSAIIFSRAKQLKFFEGINHVDYDLLKMVREYVEGFEVGRLPLWQWETAILDGFRLFRLLRANAGGRIQLDLQAHELRYSAPERAVPVNAN